jgi:hypothetical protein
MIVKSDKQNSTNVAQTLEHYILPSIVIYHN